MDSLQMFLMAVFGRSGSMWMVSELDSPSPPRTNHKHREEAQEILNQTSAGDRVSLEQKYG